MIVSERTYRFSYNTWLILLAVSLIFRVPATVLLILFAVYNLIFYKKLFFNRKRLFFIAMIATPFLLDLIFLWNNDILSEGLKHAEKRVSLLMLPFFILSQNHRFNLVLILRYYAMATTGILLFCLIRFGFLYPELFFKYLSGIHLWEMGYTFAESINAHAPALNMHVAFVVVINYYFLIESQKIKGRVHLFLRLMVFLISIIVLFYINTRLAIANAFLGIILVSLYKTASFSVGKVVKKLVLGILLFAVIALSFIKIFPYTIEKFSEATFSNLDKVGKLDELEKPEETAYNGLVTRFSIWKSGLEVVKQHPFVGVGAADGKKELINYFEESDQQFLAKYKFPVHNQYLDFWIKFGLLGLLVSLFYIGLFAYVGFNSKQVLCLFFFVLFSTSNFVDDFLIRFDGIVFSGLWLSIFTQNMLISKSRLEH